MKLIDRQQVPGTTEPVIYIGKRTYLSPGGAEQTSKKWYAEYCVDARQKWEALGTSNKATAIKLAHALHVRIQNHEPDRIKRRVELEEVTKQYMEYQRNSGRAPKTIEKYEYVLDTLVTWAKEKGVTSASSFAPKDFWAFNGWMDAEKLGRKTRADRLVIVKQMFKWAAGRGRLISFNPLTAESIPEAESEKQPCFTPDQVALLLASADPHEGAIFAVMAYAGLRFGEVQQLRWTDLILPDDKPGTIVVQRGGSGDTTKGKRSRSIPVNPELRKVLDKLPRDFGTVFTARPSKKHPEGGGMISERRLLVSLKRLCRRCKFAEPDQYKLHTFRHAFASMLARSNVSYKYALEFMGHKDSKILDLYYQMYDDTAQTAIDMIVYQQTKPNEVPAA